jgi:hypothetical protein
VLKTIKFEFDWGRSCGFPLCCVLFFVTIWGRISDLGTEMGACHENGWWSRFICRPYDKLISFGWKLRKREEVHWYRIPCPVCLFVGEPTEPKS